MFDRALNTPYCSTMKGFSRRAVIENKYVTFLIDSTCLNLVKFEFEILFNYL